MKYPSAEIEREGINWIEGCGCGPDVGFIVHGN
jgi:hypothetical protein